MKFMILSIANRDTESAAVELERYEAGELPRKEEFVKMIAYQEELVKAGVLVAASLTRTNANAEVIYFVFNEGYAAVRADFLSRLGRRDEARAEPQGKTRSRRITRRQPCSMLQSILAEGNPRSAFVRKTAKF
jgi:hypothetical protein